MREGLGLIAALRRECRDVLKWKGWKRIAPGSSPPQYERQEQGKEIRLVIAGIGPARAKAALEGLLGGFYPQILVSLGYASSLDPSLRPGDVVVGKEVLLWEAEQGSRVLGASLQRPTQQVLDHFPPEIHCREGVLVSVEQFVDKLALSQRLHPKYFPAALEMETFMLAQTLEKGPGKVSLIGLRAVSDELGFEIAPFLRKWVDETLQVKGWLLIRDLVCHPARVRILAGLYRRSRLASKSLASALRVIINHWLSA
jgi:nucleoside phosphorylase